MSAEPTSTASNLGPPRNRPGAAAIATLALAGLLAAAYYGLFWREWRHNPDLTHAIFTPLLFLILIHESRERGPWRWLPPSPGANAAIAGALGAGLLLLAAGGLYAAALDWSHALVGSLLALALALLLLAAWWRLADDRVRVIPLNWAALAAVALWPLSAPIPPGTYTRLTGNLQLLVSRVTLHVLHLLAVPAMRSGNVIVLARTTVGIEEACSGVRSLVACLVAGLFFSATLVRRPAARALILALAAPLALTMNLMRSLILTLLANDGVNIAGAWHDVTGYAVLGVTAAILGGVALWLEDRAPTGSPPPLPAARLGGWAGWSPPAGLGVGAALVLVFALDTHRRSTANASDPAPDLAQLVPAQFPGWEKVTTDDLSPFTAELQTDHLIERNYFHGAAPGPSQITIYLAYWEPGRVPVSLVESHTPETCWPGTGWVGLPPPTATAISTYSVAGRTLPPPTELFFKDGNGTPRYTWYWHLDAGRLIAPVNPFSPRALLGLAWRYGFLTSGEQWFVRISSNRPWVQIADEPLVASVLAKLQPMGL
jgi:exosortase